VKHLPVLSDVGYTGTAAVPRSGSGKYYVGTVGQ